MKENIKKLMLSVYNIPDVINYIDSINKIKEIIYKNLKCMVYYKSTDNVNFNLILKVLKRGVVLTDKIITIHLIYSDVQKKFNSNNEPLTFKNVNSGFTFLNKNDIYIFRREEFPKVIIHEILHHDNKIHSDDFKDNNRDLLLNYFNISNKAKLIFNEAIIEFWATIIHLSFVAIEYKIKFQQLLRIEIQYSLYKCFQILNLQSKMLNKIWNDNSNIFAYIIFKTILLYNINELYKIYKYPNKYDDTLLTNFIIKYSKLPKFNKNPYFIFKGKKIKRDYNSLCFMLLSDL